MAIKTGGRKTYKSMQGKVVDMDLLRKRHELTPAVGNARMNARGDEIGPGGKIIKKREQIMNEYYKTRAVTDEQTPRKETKVQPVAEEVVETKKVTAHKKTTKPVEPTIGEITEFKDMDDNWVEDENGNFIKKGE